MAELNSLYQLMKAQTEMSPGGNAILGLQGDPLTFGGLMDHVQTVVDRMNALGFGRNDRIAMVIPNGPVMAVAFLSIACAASTAPLNPNYRRAEFDYYLDDLEASALVVGADGGSAAADAAHSRGIPVLEVKMIEGGPVGLFVLQGTPQRRAHMPGIAEPEDVGLLLHTSGTTSRPKLVPLTQHNLCISALNIRRTLQLTESDRCLNVMPLFHVHGIVASLLASLAAGSGVFCAPRFYAPEFFKWVGEFRPTWYTAVPSIHQAVLSRFAANQTTIEASPLRFIRSCSAALPPQLMAEMEQVFRVPVIEAYGMTEAAHQMASNPLPPHPRKPGSVGRAAGPEIAIMDEESDKLLPAMARGEIVIRGPNVMSGYADNPGANARTFVGKWFRTGDQGFMDEDGYLFVSGRLKEVINRGGEKISPREVDEVLLDHPGVSQAVTFAVPDGALGEDVAAAVVLHDAGATEMDLRRFAALRLASFKVPRQIVILDEIPKGPTGKIQRIGMAEKLGLVAASAAPDGESVAFVAPRGELEQILAELWCDVLGRAEVGVEHEFRALGGDSVMAFQVVTRVQEILDVEISQVDLFEVPTIAAQALLLQKLIVRDLVVRSKADAERDR